MRTTDANPGSPDPGRTRCVSANTPAHELTEAFSKARYVVCGPNGHCTLQIGGRLPDALCLWADGLLRHRRAWIITPCNPGGVRCRDADNRRALARLDALLTPCSRTRLPTISQDPDGAWPDEPGWLIGDLDEATVHDLARRFGQAAVVAVHANDIRLVWL